MKGHVWCISKVPALFTKTKTTLQHGGTFSCRRTPCLNTTLLSGPCVLCRPGANNREFRAPDDDMKKCGHVNLRRRPMASQVPQRR